MRITVENHTITIDDVPPGTQITITTPDTTAAAELAQQVQWMRERKG